MKAPPIYLRIQDRPSKFSHFNPNSQRINNDKNIVISKKYKNILILQGFM
jgi:hypothetical protein